MARLCLSTIVSLCLLSVFAVNSASAQGLLGTPHFDTEFVYFHPKDADIKRFDSFIPGVQSNLNVPILGEASSTLGLDAFGRFRGLWIDGSDGGIDLDAQLYQYSVGTNLFYRGWQNIRP